MLNVFKTEAIVFKKKNLLHTDIVLTIFSPSLGKIRVLAKGIRKITSKRLPHNQTGNLIRAVIYRKRETLYLRETHLISAFSRIKTNPQKIAHLYFIFFILDRLLPEGSEEKALFLMLKKFLIDLSRSEQFTLSQLEGYLHTILRLLGYAKDKASFHELIGYIEEIINEKIPHVVI